jgi:DNA-binding XRE family transcriptional regulator
MRDKICPVCKQHIKRHWWAMRTVNSFASACKIMREGKEIKANWLAQKVGIKPSAISQIEKGVFLPEIDTAKKIVSYLQPDNWGGKRLLNAYLREKYPELRSHLK